MTHAASVLAGPIAGTHSTHMLSGHHFGRHWHDAYGFGILEEGAQRSGSGRGEVEAFAGQVITNNPGEVGSPEDMKPEPYCGGWDPIILADA